MSDQRGHWTEITQVQDQLPKDSHPPVVHVSSGSQTSLMYIALYSPDGAMAPPQIIDYTIRNVQPLLQTVNGVSQARLMPPGGSNGNTLAMRVWLNPVAMTAYGITPADVRETLQTQNVNCRRHKTRGWSLRLAPPTRTSAPSNCCTTPGKCS
ncbi:MAG: efflux RND transporter permease subunit, partial [Halioglobus sp.]|nr:efflux RND transporter permease subunit [Halioglobus sp.]